MNSGEEHIIDELASRVNGAGGVIEGIDAIIDFEETLHRKQKESDSIVEKRLRNSEVPGDIVEEIKRERREGSINNPRLKGQMAEVEEAIKNRIAQGRTPSHAVIEDNGVKIVDRDDGDER